MLISKLVGGISNKVKTMVERHEEHIKHTLEDSAEKVTTDNDVTTLDGIGLMVHDYALEKKNLCPNSSAGRGRVEDKSGSGARYGPAAEGRRRVGLRGD